MDKYRIKRKGTQFKIQYNDGVFGIPIWRDMVDVETEYIATFDTPDGAMKALDRFKRSSDVVYVE